MIKDAAGKSFPQRSMSMEKKEILIPGGTFQMGSVAISDEQPIHSVTVSPFYMDNTLVTQRDYVAMTGENPSFFNGNDDLPVEQISWFDAVKYCNKRSVACGLEECYDTINWTCDITKSGYRLPSEAEWEYACRAGTSTAYFWGDVIDGSYCWFYDNSNQSTHPVGEKKPNAFGLYDLSGNVWEWCNDWYGSYDGSPQINPITRGNGGSRVLRGGSWINGGGGFVLRSAYRDGVYPGYWVSSLGFRCVRAV
jgi:formylglycine-generating enzyme required for sulfatase activity